jgi:sugar lactone lactonase YvrE
MAFTRRHHTEGVQHVLSGLGIAGLVFGSVALAGCPEPRTGTGVPVRATQRVTASPSLVPTQPAPAATPLVPTSSAGPTSAVVAGKLKVPMALPLGGAPSGLGGGLITNNSAGLISDRGGALQAAPGLSLRTATPLRHALLQAERTPLPSRPVGGVRVFLADAAGRALPGLQPVLTAADGTFQFQQVPAGFNFLVVAEVPTAGGKSALFRTLVYAGPLGATTEVTAASTMVTASVLDGLERSDLGGYNASRFQSAIDTLDARLEEAQLPDFTDPVSVKASITKLSQEVAELRSILTEVREDLAKVQLTLDELKASLDKANQPSASPTPVPTQTPAPTPTPTATPRLPFAVTTLAGSTKGYEDGSGAAAAFSDPWGLAADAAGNVFVADAENDAIRKVTAGGSVSTVAGGLAVGDVDGVGEDAQFHYPEAVAVAGDGTLYVADYSNHRIRKITPSGVVTTLAGSSQGFSDGVGARAKFSYPAGICVDAAGNVYVSDHQNHSIRKVSPSGSVTTLAGATPGFNDGTGPAAQFNAPVGIAVDVAGQVYVADAGNHRIRKVSPAGAVTTLAGSVAGFLDGSGADTRLHSPRGVCLGPDGTLFIADTNNHRIRALSPAGVLTTLAGALDGYTDGAGRTARFSFPAGVAVDGSGTLYVADLRNHRIRKIQP